MTDLPSHHGGYALAYLAAAFVLTSCSTAYWSAAADDEVNALLAAQTLKILGDRAGSVLRPSEDPAPKDPEPGAAGARPRRPGAKESGAEGAEPPPTGAPPAATPPAGTPAGTPEMPADPQQPTQDAPLQVDLATALRLAVQNNRRYKSQRESLFLTGLSTTGTRFDFGPQLGATLSGSHANAEDGNETNSAGAGFRLGQILPTGGRFSLNTNGSRTRTLGPSDLPSDDIGIGTSIGLELTQPLLRGFGYEISHDALIQAERSLVYGIRDFELFRQDFSIDIAESYYELVRQQTTLGNDERDFEQAVFDRNKAEKLRQMERNDEQTVFRAQRREVLAKDALISSRAAFGRAVERFTIQLGLPTTTRIEIVPNEPEVVPVRTNVASAVEAAKRNRLDLKNQLEQIEDSRRSLRIAENGMLPDLDLVLRSTFSGDDRRPESAAPDRWDTFAGVELTIPLQRTPERNRLRATRIRLEQAEREYQQTLDELEAGIRDQIRQLQSTEQRITLQQSQIAFQQRAVTVSEIRYASGNLDNRDLLEAREALIEAQNTLVGLKISHFIGRLRLLRNLGILFIDDKGGW